MTAIIPIPKVDLSIRVATMDDLPFMDELQKKHSKALGYFPTKQFEGYIQQQAVLVAEGTKAHRHEGTKGGDEEQGNSEASSLSASEPPSPLGASMPSCLRASPLGYIISKDRYLKRDELGVIFQLCVEPGVQRKLVGAALVKEVFARSAYGCRLYCCWCAQDLEANYFWESMGFVPVAFRAGSGKKKRVHIFWQKRIVDGDTETRWWYPFQTNSGAIREDRLVFPIPPGVSWRDVEAVVLPETGKPKLEARSSKRIRSPESKSQKAPPRPAEPKKLTTMQFGLRFGPPPLPDTAPAPALPAPSAPVEKMKRQPREPREAREARAKVKIDRKYLVAARELRDRYLEHVNTPGCQLPSGGKYNVGRLIAQNVTIQRAEPKQLPEAA